MNDTETTAPAPEFSPELEARIRAHEQKRAARIARLNAAADRASANSSALYDRHHRLGSVIPMGQPILVGHYSEGRDRRFRDRLWRMMGRSVEEAKRAENLRARAAAAESNTAIMSDDPLADRKLAAEIAEAEKLQAQMKAVNLAIRKNLKAGTEAQVAALVAMGYEEPRARELLKPDFAGRIGYPDYRLTNNGANIRRMKKRLELVSKNQALPVEEVEGANGIRYEDNPPENRVRLYFPGKPDADTRDNLKSRGFRWSPTIGAWQAYRNAWSVETARSIAGITTPANA